jgi:hypothetical protein
MPKGATGQKPPEMFTGLELLPLVAPAVAGSKHIYDALREGRLQVKADEPLVFAVLESITEAGQQTLTVMCRNLGAHGVYLERITMSDPKAEANQISAKLVAKVGTILESHIGDSYSRKEGESVASRPESNSPAVRIQCAEAACLEISFPALTGTRLAKKPFGKFDVHYTVLGVARNDLYKTVEFSVRNK